MADSRGGITSVPVSRHPELTRAASALKAHPKFDREEHALVVVGDVVEVRRRDHLVVIGLTSALSGVALGPYLERLAERHAGLLLLGDGEGVIDRIPEGVIAALQPVDGGADALLLAVAGLFERVELARREERRRGSLERARYELGELVEIARAITQERDIDRLLGRVLEKSRLITGADAGSIYVLEDPARDGQQVLRFKLSQNDSVSFESAEFVMPVSTRSIAGAAAVTRKPINLPDVYDIPTGAPYGFDRSFDEKVGYRTRSMIAVPMISAEDEVIGVIQLINKKRAPEKKLTTPELVAREVVPFQERDEELLRTLASQAGIALENALLYDEIRSIFEGFVRASVQAIEQRDPTTSGHSLRVSVLSCRLAEIVDRVDAGPFAAATFGPRDLKELEYASLLHDFGKIGVREQVLVKAKKLYPHQLEAVRSRLDYLLKAAEAEALEKKVALMAKGAGASDLAAVDDALERRRGELHGALAVILQANEPTVLNEGDFRVISELGALEYVDAQGRTRTLLTPEEVHSLQVTRGSLNGREVDEIRSHVTHTIAFLSKIPWGKTMSNIPHIAGAHHEKLDGSGYPHGLKDEVIPIPSKIMTIADIFDALTARDRPYKRAMPVQKALDILGFEVKDGHVDPELVRLFTEAKVFEVVEGDLSY